MADGIIKKDDVITDDALQFGKEYAENVKLAIASNEELKKSALALFDVYKQLQGVSNQSNFKSLQTQQITLTQQATKAYESQGKALEKVDLERQRSLSSLLATRNKLQNAQTNTNKENIKERETLRLTNLEIKRSLTFMGQLTSARDKALKTVQEYQAKQALGIQLNAKETASLKASQKEFEKYDKSIKSIKKSTNDFKENVGNYPKTVGIALSSIKSLLPIVGAGFGIKEAWNFTKEARQFAIEAKGVEFAFERLGKVGVEAFEKTKRATRGMLSDLDIQKTLVDFNNFNISLEETDTLMEFLSVRAAQTGKDFDYLKDSLVEGLSKESKLRIDNLGISAKELNAQLEKTPNFVQAVATIAKKEIAEAGSILDKAANAQQEWNAAYDNFQLQLGKGLVAKASDAMYSFGTNILRAITPAQKLNNTIREEQIELNTLVGSILKTNEKEDERKILIEQLTEKYPFFLKFINDENTSNEALRKGLLEVNSLYIKRLAISRLQEKINLDSKQAKLADATGDLALRTEDYQKALNAVNLMINKNTLNTDISSQSLERQNEILKQSINAEITRLSQLKGQGQATDVQIRNLIKYEKALNGLAEATRIFNTTGSKFGFAETAVEDAKKEIEELEKLLGITKNELNELFDDDANAVLITVKLDPKAKEAALKQFMEDRDNLNRQRLQLSIDAETAITTDEKYNLGERLKANIRAYEEREKLLILNKEIAIREAKGRNLEITRLEEAFNAEIVNLNKKRQDDVNAILESEFGKTKKRLEREQKIQQQAIDDRINAEQEGFKKDLEGLRGEARLLRIKKYEDKLIQITRDGAIERLNIQIKAIQTELDDPYLNPEQRIALEEMLAAAKIALSDEVTEKAIYNAEKQIEAERKLYEFKNRVIQDSANNIANALDLDANNIEMLLSSFLIKAETTGDKIIDKYNQVAQTMAQIGAVGLVTGDILQSVFSANIDKIDEEIDANEEYFAKRLELAENDESQQRALEAEREIKRKELEEKKRQEQIKAAKFQKAQAIFQIGLNTAQAILGIWAQVPKFDFGVSAGLLTGFVSSLGALQMAAVLAKPIPKYKLGAGVNGRPLHPGGLAEVAEVRPEIIKEPGKAPFIQHKRAVLNLAKGTQVIPNLNQLHAASIISSVESANQNLNEFETLIAFDLYHNDMMEEMKRNTKAIKDLKLSVRVSQQNMDIPYQMFRSKHIKWHK